MNCRICKGPHEVYCPPCRRTISIDCVGQKLSAGLRLVIHVHRAHLKLQFSNILCTYDRTYTCWCGAEFHGSWNFARHLTDRGDGQVCHVFQNLGRIGEG